ncbi:MAG: polysaccharide deacetylase family protein [Vicinamibacterales bacterium]|nr:polysaccharide deacetylase family protein [Vicinamibacterales bacterium]
MAANAALKKLGYSDQDRLVIVHTDDIGMCQASLEAFAGLWGCGTISSGAVMVPCPWFPAAAAYCRAHPDVDMGVHVTLTAEWEGYRWVPVSTTDPASGLLDAEGYLHRRQPAVMTGARPEAVHAEISGQVARAVKAGIDVTHMDAHMLTALLPRLAPAYVEVARAARVPIMFPSSSLAGELGPRFGTETARELQRLAIGLEADGFPLVDCFASMPLSGPDDHLDCARQALKHLPPGITHLALHPATDTPELRAICSDWPSRVADYQTFMNTDLKQFMHDEGIHVIGYRALRALIR